MSSVALGLICGTVFGTIPAGSMIPVRMDSRRTAIIAALINRFVVGLVIPTIKLSLAWPVTGPLIGVLFSLPEAIITKAYACIMAFGALEGLAFGFVAEAVRG